MMSKKIGKHLKGVNVGYQYFPMCVGGDKRSSSPCNPCFDEECKIYFKLFKFSKPQSVKGHILYQYKKVVV